MKKRILMAMAGAAFAVSSMSMPNTASAHSLVVTNVISNGSVVSGFSAEQTVQRDFWSDLVDDILDRPHDNPPPPPPPPHRGPHHPPPPPPPPPHHGPHHPAPPPHRGPHNPAPPPHRGPHNPAPPPHHGPHNPAPPPHHGPHR